MRDMSDISEEVLAFLFASFFTVGCLLIGLGATSLPISLKSVSVSCGILAVYISGYLFRVLLGDDI